MDKIIISLNQMVIVAHAKRPSPSPQKAYLEDTVASFMAGPQQLVRSALSSEHGLSFPSMIDAFGGPSSTRGNTGPFWVGSGMAILRALITFFFFVSPIDTDGMVIEDSKIREYLEVNGSDTAAMGLTAIDVAVNENSSVEKGDEKNSADEHPNI
ncbi:hypothetical protein GALMADRAFT_145393 [Galerina marginata CBS 339.88]|uniref:Uncharacterized protein n=1 Tax=Galerina marginata (strain CBS 339.88) TaxID=685588 RepID=A0A067SFF2_GALM3|nr:hypothetical protein GALMADRAFT_145393 [Galerina marginata CBS 339.88]